MIDKQVQYNDRRTSAESYLAETVDALKSRFKDHQGQFTKPAIRTKLRSLLDDKWLTYFEQLYLEDARTDDLSKLASSSTTPQQVDTYWSAKVETARERLTKSGVGRESSSNIANTLRSLVDSLFVGEPFTFHPDATERIVDFSRAILRERQGVTAEQVENSIKPYKYEVEVDDREWAAGRERAEVLLETEIKRSQSELTRLGARVGGQRSLKALMRHVEELQRWEDDQRKKRVLRKISGTADSEPPTDDGPVFDAYKYSAAQRIDGEYGVTMLKSLMGQATTLFASPAN